MKLIEALEILKRPTAPAAARFNLSLVCGFSPLHLQTFLAAHLRLLIPDRRIDIQAGLYGDVAGSLERLKGGSPDAVALIIEWPDLDPRLGIRRLGGWKPSDLPDILGSARAQAARLSKAVERASAVASVAVCLPTLPLPPINLAPGWQASSFDFELQQCVASLGAEIHRPPSVRAVNAQRLARLSPPDGRFDPKSEMNAGFPYTLPHADAVAEMLARLLHSRPPKKGLITDLDDTLWSGVLGEEGVGGVSWDLDHHSQKHGLYQQLLRALSEQGVLIAIASKNDPRLVEEFFQKAQPILPSEKIFPIEANWGPKSESISRIFAAWNIGSESAVFVDDSAMDLAEVKAAHPEIECIEFPRKDDRAAYELLERLRDLFGKDSVSAEDAIRLQSIRAAAAQSADSKTMADSPDAFLQKARGKLTLTFGQDPPDPRALELVNKTNQFNLNGKRYEETEWRNQLKRPGAFLLLAAYEDKYGPLGKIAAVSGREENETLSIDTWVLSCRAFSRRIEHHCLEHLFKKFGAREIVFAFSPTPRNGPLQSFFAEFLGGPPQPGLRLSRKLFSEKCPHLFQEVQEIPNG